MSHHSMISNKTGPVASLTKGRNEKVTPGSYDDDTLSSCKDYLHMWESPLCWRMYTLVPIPCGAEEKRGGHLQPVSDTMNPNCSDVCSDVHILDVQEVFTLIGTQCFLFSWWHTFLYLPFLTLKFYYILFYMCSQTNCLPPHFLVHLK
jgi:hypothetical protein